MNLIRTTCKITFIITGFVVFFAVVIFAFSSIDLKGRTLLQRLTGNIAKTGSRDQSLLRFREIENVRDLDILFIGSSHAYKGFDPRLFQAKGYSSFNMGSSAQTLLNTYFLLKCYLPRIRPKVIVLELYPAMFSNDGYESTLDLLVNVPISWELLEMSLATGNPHAVIAYFQKIIRDYKYPLAKFNQMKIKGEKYIPGGYVETNMVRNEKLDKKSCESKVLDSQLRYFSKIIELVKKFNITIVGVIHPLSKDYFKTFKYRAIVEDLRNVAVKYGVIILDFNDTMNLDPKLDYSDISHLNKKGVIKFNNALMDKLEAMKILPRDG
ncbi:MAG: hypothetical protein NTZ95_03925 [Candidatus Omnitrophica bacterium]|nr:hypothetical protein [Candidatus Omnitrophota bacterium]